MKYLGKKFRRIFLITTLIVAILSCYLNINSAKDYYSQFTSQEKIQSYFDNNEVIPNGTMMLGTGGDTVTIFLTTTGAGTWIVPDDWNNTNNSIECIGGGAGGVRYNGLRWAGGGGAYSKKNNLTLTPGASISYNVGIGGAASYGQNGEATWFVSNTTVYADYGRGHGEGGVGGSIANSIGDVKYAGGNASYGGAGGGAAGMHGNGNNGGVVENVGGSGDAGYGGNGGAVHNNGGDGTEWDATHGSGGGAGWGSHNGGLYGAGGSSGSSPSIGIGGQGLIVITYTPAASGNSNFFMFFN